MEWQKSDPSWTRPHQVGSLISTNLSLHGPQTTIGGAAGARQDPQALPLGRRQGYFGWQMQSKLDKKYPAKGARRLEGAKLGEIRAGAMTTLALAGLDLTRQGVGRDGGSMR